MQEENLELCCRYRRVGLSVRSNSVQSVEKQHPSCRSVDQTVLVQLAKYQPGILLLAGGGRLCTVAGIVWQEYFKETW